MSRRIALVDELPFAGHPTLGNCHAWLEAGGRARHACQGALHGAPLSTDHGAGVKSRRCRTVASSSRAMRATTRSTMRSKSARSITPLCACV